MTKKIRPSVVLVKDGKVLVLKSRYSSGEFYLLPGGSTEDFETVKETAIRETKEETNYDIKIKKLLYIQEWIDRKRGKDIMYMIFLGEILGGRETYLNDPYLEEGHILAIEWKTVAELEQSVFHPKEILPYLKKDIQEDFREGTRYLKEERTC